MTAGGIGAKLTVADLEVEGRRVFVRVDFNVPFDDDGGVADDRRIRAALPTLRHLLARGATLVIGSHLGRPRGAVVEGLRMAPVAARLSELLGRPVRAVPDVAGDVAAAAVAEARPGDVVVLENLRFHPGETSGDEGFARALAGMCDVYVNDAFGAAHRAHASVSVLPRLVGRAAAGELMARELGYLGRALASPELPFLLVFGGAKVSDKVPVLRHLLERVDVALIGGGMAYTFLAAEGVAVGNSRLEPDLVSTAGAILAEARERGVRILLPTDHVCAASLESGVATSVGAPGVPEGLLGLDIGPTTAGRYASEIAGARTVLWNGPMGVFEIPPFDAGTRVVAQAVAEVTERGATTVVGGGDTAAAAHLSGVAERVSHVSTGGGAALEFLQGRELPGVAALTDAPEAVR